MRQILLVAALLFAPLPALAAEVVAVFEVQDMRLGEARLSARRRRALTDLLRNFLAEGGAYKVVPQSGLRRAMREAKKDSYKECFDEDCQLEIGKAVSANKVVTTKIIQVGSLCIVTSTLFDLRTETTDRAEHVKGQCAEESLALTLEKVAAKLKADGPAEVVDAPPPERWEPGKSKKVIVSFRSEPPGALIQIDGELACRDSSTGCRRSLSAGKHVISMQKERYTSRTEEVFVEEGAEIAWQLEANFSRLEIRTEPPGLEVRIDGQSAGRTPLEPELEPGEHVVELADGCYQGSERRVTVLQGRGELVELDAVPREGAIEVSAIDATGNAVPASVLVDDILVGQAPDLIKVNICAKRVRVEGGEHGAWEGTLAIGERETQAIEAKLQVGTTATQQPPPPPPGIGLRIGAQAMLSILCLRAEGSSCADRLLGYGGVFSLAWPARPPVFEQNVWFFRGLARAGFLYYPASFGASALEIPVSGGIEAGIAGPNFEYALGGEALYAFRKLQGLIEPGPDATDEERADYEALNGSSPHAFDLGLSLLARYSYFELGGAVYLPVAGIGEKIGARVWMGIIYDL